jgi:hypothetical protein
VPTPGEAVGEIVGRSRVSVPYSSTAEFRGKVPEPFGNRFSHGNPFRPVTIRECAAIADTPDGPIVNGTAFYGSIVFERAMADRAPQRVKAGWEPAGHGRW